MYIVGVDTEGTALAPLCKILICFKYNIATFDKKKECVPCILYIVVVDIEGTASAPLGEMTSCKSYH